MGRAIGIVAGSGRFVAGAVSELRRSGLRCVVLALEGASRPELKKAADGYSSVKPGAIGRALAFFKDQHISEIILLGKVQPGVVFRPEDFDGETWRRLQRVEGRSATAVLKAVIALLEAQGLTILDPGSLLSPHLCKPGVLTRAKPSPATMRDIDLGLRIARQAADLEIGQTLIVKAGVVVAVEGMEGTDRAIQRGGRLSGPGFVAVKAGRTCQDMRLDLPAVGLETVKTLLRAGGVALGLEAGKVAFFQRPEAVSLADARGASIVVRSVG